MAVLAIALIVAGAALASLGVLRLTRAAFVALPRNLAISIVVAGAAVVAFGSLLPRFVVSRQAPRIALEREPAGATPAPLPHVALRGVVSSLDGAPVRGIGVTLYTGTGGPRTVKTDARGAYAFAPLAPGGPYRVAVSYRGATFQRVLMLPTPPVPITVAPTTNKPAHIRIRAASLALVGDARGVQAVYAATIENAGRDAYSGGVPLPVLPGAMAVEPRAGVDRSQLAVQDGVLYSSAPVMPGSTPISYTYVAPISERGADVVVDTTFPTDRFDLLVAGRLRTKADERPNGDIRLGGRTYQRYTWRGLGPRQMVSAHVRPSSSTAVLRTGAIAAGGVVAAFVVLLPLLRRRRALVAGSPQVAVPQ